MAEGKNNKVFLLDAFALIYRAFFAFSRNPRYNSKGMNTSAIFGFTNTLFDLLKNEQPTHMAVVFDSIEPTEREIEYAEYKAQREPPPEDLINSIPYIKKIIEGFNIPIFEYGGYEADDIIGTLAKQAEKKKYDVYMVTPDKDFGQLVTDHIFIYKPPRFGGDVEIMGVKEVLAKWEIKDIGQVIDMLGMQGDASDNIPGIPGIGEKTAKKLIKEFESLEGLIKNADQLKGKLRENVENFAEQGLMSKRLATIILDVPVKFDPSEMKVKEPDKEALGAVFSELEFRTLGKRIIGEDYSIKGGGIVQPTLFDDDKSNGAESEPIIGEGNNIENTKHTYHLVDTPVLRKKLIQDLAKQKTVCFDSETTGIDANNAELVGLSFCYKPKEAYYVPFPKDQKEVKKQLEEFKAFFENEKIEKIAQNIKYDMLVLKWYDMEVKGVYFDTMLAHYLIEPDQRHNMNVLAENYLDYEPVSIEKLIGAKGSKQSSMRDVPLDEIKEYASEDADITLQLKKIFVPLVKERNVEKVFSKIEMPLVEVLTQMEFDGVAIDTKALKSYSNKLLKEIIKIQDRVYKIAGQEFNMASPKQLGEILFDKLKLDSNAKRTKTGQYATGEEVLIRLSDQHEIVQLILDHRESNKLKSTYLDALPKLINPKTGRIHTSFNQAVAATGRLSSANPNLQNIPIRTARGREVRRAFIPRSKDYVILSADYSQIELRIIADVSKDKTMQDAFISGLDIHTTTASKVYKVPIDKVDDAMRRNAKTINFSITYGVTPFGLAQRLNLSRAEATELIDNYFKTYPAIKEHMDKSINFARKNGFVETIMGRRRYLRDINSQNATVRGFAERNAINAPIQGSAADMIKIAMINIHRDMKKAGLKSKMTLQVHDELVFDAHRKELNTLKQLVEDNMKNAIKMNVPIVVDMGDGEDWLSAH